MKIALIALWTLVGSRFLLKTAQLLGADAAIDFEREQARIDQSGTEIDWRRGERGDRLVFAPKSHRRRDVLSQPEGIEPVGAGRGARRCALRRQDRNIGARALGGDNHAFI